MRTDLQNVTIDMIITSLLGTTTEIENANLISPGVLWEPPTTHHLSYRYGSRPLNEATRCTDSKLRNARQRQCVIYLLSLNNVVFRYTVSLTLSKHDKYQSHIVCTLPMA